MLEQYTEFEFSDLLTEDIQFDLALLSLNFPGSDPLIVAYTTELKRRGASLPVHAVMKHNVYAYMKEELVYQLEKL